jgi:hypothetical protein
MPYEYKCVAGPTVVSVRKAKERQYGVKAFEDIMNREAADGWEFVTVDEFHTSEPEGWLSRKRVYVSSKMLVFRKLKPEPMVMPVQETIIDMKPKPAPIATRPAEPEVKIEKEPELKAERLTSPEKVAS